VIEDMVSEDDLVLPDGRRLLLDDFIADIATAGAAGYCVTSGLVDAYTKCLAAPVFSAAGKVEATICLVVPIDTSEEKTGNLIALLRERAARLSITG
jgi:DNA-binding IclR family transcriptional regulator